MVPAFCSPWCSRMHRYPPPRSSLVWNGPTAGGGSDSSGAASITHVGTTLPSGRYSVRGTISDPNDWRSSHFLTNTSTAGHDHGRMTELASVRGPLARGKPFGRGLVGGWSAYQSSFCMQYRPIAVATTFGSEDR